MVNNNDQHELENDLEITNEEEAEITDNNEPELEETEGRLEDRLKKLRTQLAAAEEAKRSSLEQLQRERADFLNARKRLEEQALRERERSLARHIEDLLPLCDSFDMAMKDPAWQNADAGWKKGVEGIYSQLMALLKSYDVTVLSPVGEAFNPHEHEALIDNGGEHKVTDVIQKGYKRGEMMIRAARVAVG